MTASSDWEQDGVLKHHVSSAMASRYLISNANYESQACSSVSAPVLPLCLKIHVHVHAGSRSKSPCKQSGEAFEALSRHDEAINPVHTR